MDKVLTEEEKKRVLMYFPGCQPKLVNNQYKIELMPLRYMPKQHAHMLCYWCDNLPFYGTTPDEWVIERQSDTIKVKLRRKHHSYNIDIDNGNVLIFNNTALSNLGTHVYPMQFYMLHYYAFPIFFEPTHWGNNKNPFQLGIAVPNRQPLVDLLMTIHQQDEHAVDEWFFDKELCGIDINDIDVYNKLFDELSIANKIIT